MLNRINKKAVLLKMVYGAVGGGVWCFYFEKIEINSTAFFLSLGMATGLLAGLSSISSKIKKTIYGIMGGAISGTFLFLLKLLPGSQQGYAIVPLILPITCLFVGVSIGIVRRLSSSLRPIVIGSLVGSLISVCLFIVGGMLTLGLSWKHPGARWPVYGALVIMGMVMLLGIGIKECFKDGTKT